MIGMEEVSTAAADYAVEVPQKDRTGNFYVFYAANLIAQIDRERVPDYKLGGIIKPEFRTLDHCKGYIRQCQITPLRQAMQGIWHGFVHPERKANMPSTYTIVQNGERKTFGLVPDEDIPGGMKPDGLLRIPIYPADEIDGLTGQTDGLVRMPVKNDVEMELAQKFLFPNWADISDGITYLPTSLPKLRMYFRKLKDEASDQFYRNVAEAAEISCVQADEWFKLQINAQAATYRWAQAEGKAWSFGTVAILGFEQTGIARPDLVAQGQAGQLDALVESTSNLAKAVARQSNGETGITQSVDADEYAEFQEYRKWKAAQNAVVGTTAPPSESETEVNEFTMGDTVMVDGQQGTITFRPGGRYTVTFPDGTKQTVSGDKLQKA